MVLFTASLFVRGWTMNRETEHDLAGGRINDHVKCLWSSILSVQVKVYVVNTRAQLELCLKL